MEEIGFVYLLGTTLLLLFPQKRVIISLKVYANDSLYFINRINKKKKSKENRIKTVIKYTICDLLPICNLSIIRMVVFNNKK